MNFYKIIKSDDIKIKDDALIINSNKFNELAFIQNDVEFNNAKDEQGYFLLSGGGAYLINGRYLTVIKRSPFAKVNPNRLSLFTGRSDGIDEILNPTLLLRELFEELIIYKDGNLLYPKNTDFQEIIDKAYKNFEHNELINLNTKRLDMNIVSIIPSRNISINGKSFLVDFHVSSNSDINALFIFNVELELDNVSFEDGEFHIENGEKVFHNREIYLIDVVENVLIDPYTKNNFVLDEFSKSEHLEYILKNLNQKVKNENNY